MASAEYQRNRYHTNRAILIAELGGKCVDCGTTENLQFDHVVKELKSFHIGANFNRSLEVLRKEAAKCVLRCKDHHTQKTIAEKDFISRTNSPQPIEEWKHGTHTTAYQRKCTCLLCENYKEQRNYNKRKVKDRVISKEIIHGTRAGYLREGRQGLEHCDACKKANTEYTISLQRKKRSNQLS